jgi:phage gp45-like
MPIAPLPINLRLDDSVENIDRKMEKMSNKIRVACPGVVTAFDSAKQTVSVQLAIRERKSFHGKPFQDMDIPELRDVPIYMPRAGNFVLTMPVTVGDECLVIFADMCIDSWYQSGGTKNTQMDNRRHDLSDGFAIIGPWSQPKVISSYSTDSAFLRNLNDDSYIEIRDSDINIKTPTKITIEAGSEVEVKAPTVNVNATTTNVNSPTVAVTGGNITLTGSTMVNIAGGNAQIDGKDFLQHVHTNVQTGIGNSGPVA